MSIPGLPPGLSMSPEGLIAGTPTAAGEYEFSVTVTDANGATAAELLAITVMPAMTLTVTGIPGAVVGQAFTFQVTPTGGTPPFTLTAA